MNNSFIHSILLKAEMPLFLDHKKIYTTLSVLDIDTFPSLFRHKIEYFDF